MALVGWVLKMGYDKSGGGGGGVLVGWVLKMGGQKDGVETSRGACRWDIITMGLDVGGRLETRREGCRWEIRNQVGGM